MPPNFICLGSRVHHRSLGASQRLNSIQLPEIAIAKAEENGSAGPHEIEQLRTLHRIVNEQICSSMRAPYGTDPIEFTLPAQVDNATSANAQNGPSLNVSRCKEADDAAARVSAGAFDRSCVPGSPPHVRAIDSIGPYRREGPQKRISPPVQPQALERYGYRGREQQSLPHVKP